MTGHDELISDADFARRMRRSTRTTQRWRDRNLGPAWIKHCGRIWYKVSTVDRWLDGKERHTASLRKRPGRGGARE